MIGRYNCIDIKFGDIYTYLIRKCKRLLHKREIKSVKIFRNFQYVNLYNLYTYVCTVYSYLSGKYGIHKKKVDPSRRLQRITMSHG